MAWHRCDKGTVPMPRSKKPRSQHEASAFILSYGVAARSAFPSWRGTWGK